MTRQGFFRGAIVTLLMVAFPSVGWSQQGWDPDRWLELVGEGDRFYSEAIATPEDDDENYRRLLRESVRYKQEALEMLRRALLLRR